MEQIAWPQLMRLGLGVLRLQPDAFWSLTPIELMLLAGVSEQTAPLDRDRFLDLARQFPDDAARKQMELDQE